MRTGNPCDLVFTTKIVTILPGVKKSVFYIPLFMALKYSICLVTSTLLNFCDIQKYQS